MAHKFSLRQFVRFTSPNVATAHVSDDGRYEVTRLMPEDATGIVSYRLKSANGERVARETELVDADEPVH